jgi:glycosyltransferase involved in cell wall biosynthesis
MKVLVLSHMVPFINDEMDDVGPRLVNNLKSVGIDAEGFRLPFTGQPWERLPEELYIARSLRLWDVDRMIALTFPTYLVPHHCKIAWILSQCRAAYDVPGPGPSDIPAGPRGDEVRSMVQRADRLSFSEARALYAGSQSVVDRVGLFQGLHAQMLPVPLGDPELFFGGENGGYILAAGRVNAANRQALLVKALSLCSSRSRLVIAGPPDTEADADGLIRLIAEHHLGDRVGLELRVLPRRDLAALVNGALAVAWLPLREDRPSDIVMAAMQAGKPVLAAIDSGWAAQHVLHERTGLATEPTPDALASAIESLFSSPARARSYGAEGRSVWTAVGATWRRTIDTLLS